MTNQRFITILGYVATFTSVCMYVSYLQQIGLNLSGQKGGGYNLLLRQSTVVYG